VETLLTAWRSVGQAVPLKIAGDGPLAPAVREAAAHNPAIEWLRAIPHEKVYDLIGGAAFLVLPSNCYEGFPCVVVEAFAKSTPVIASKRGAMADLVEDNYNGLHVIPGDPVDLAAKARWLFSNPSAVKRMGDAARDTFSRNYTADANHEMLMAIYARATAASPWNDLHQMDTATTP
jgi:glycosyltransferase involved in cell wall biosynthesis